jgi:nitrate/TMAO reductase-like tetraheme cytochrome c subunit
MGKVLLVRRAILFSIVLVLALAGSALAVKEGYRERLKREFTRAPWAGMRLVESACVECHTSRKMKLELRDIPRQWRESFHFRHDVSCDSCHGGDKKDASMSMSHERGFIGVPTDAQVPDFCGKCHVGVLENYMRGGHGRALRESGKGPTCVTCHGSHGIQKASIDIIDEERCSQCHSYERAKFIKQALFVVENKMGPIEEDLEDLRAAGVDIDEESKAFFRIHAEFRSLFHAIEVNVIKNRSSDFSGRLDLVEEKLREYYAELGSRKRFTSFLFLVFVGMSVAVHMLIKDVRSRMRVDGSHEAERRVHGRRETDE